jgi:hypothetical protein
MKKQPTVIADKSTLLLALSPRGYLRVLHVDVDAGCQSEGVYNEYTTKEREI